ncbi:MAG: hypothetical protein ACREEL_00070 [Stellaceae bacterium]
MIITPAAAIDDPKLLGGAFVGSSWNTWRAILKAAYAEPLDDAELALFHSVAGQRAPPSRRVRELVVIAGRRSGKDSIASAVATGAAMGDYSTHLRPGERASVLCLACDREQARIVHRYVVAYFQRNLLLQQLIERETDDGLELNNGVEIIVATNSFRAVRGRTVACAIFDEAAYWRSEESANPDEEVYNAVLPGMVTLPGSILVIITTAYRRAGLAYQKYQAHFGKDDDDVLVVYGPSTAFNPSLPQAVIDAALARDPEAAGAEWLSQWRSDLTDFLDRGLIEAAVDPGVVVRPPDGHRLYVGFCDPSGGRGDSFTCAIAHAEGETAVLDALYEKRAPFDPSTVVAEVAEMLRTYGCARATGDNFGAAWVAEAFEKHGIRYIVSDRKRSAVYLDALPLFTAGRARITDSPRLVHQLVSLERRTTRAGKDEVNHPSGSADDAANAACGALVLAATDARPTLIPRAAVKIDRPDDKLGFVRAAFAALWLASDGECGYVLFAYCYGPGPRGSLVITGFDQRPWSGAVPEIVAASIDMVAETAREQNVRSMNSGVSAIMLCPAQLQQQCSVAMDRVFAPRLPRIDARRREVGCEAIDARYLRDPTDLILQASAVVHEGLVRLTAAAEKLTSGVPLWSALAARPGEAMFDDPLRTALLLGIVHGIGEPPPDAPPAIPAARLTAFG